MNKLYDYLTGLVQDQFSESTNGYNQEEMTQMIYTVATEMGVDPENFDEVDDKDAVETAVSNVSEFTEASAEDLALFSEMYDAETELGIEFSEEDINNIQEIYSQSSFSEGSDEELAECAFAAISGYLEQNEYAFLSQKDKSMIGRDIKSAAQSLGVYYKPTRWEKFKAKFSSKNKPDSTGGKLWVVGKNVAKSPYGQLVAGMAMHNANLKLAEKINKHVGTQQFSAMDALTDYFFSEAESVVAERTHADDARAKAETVEDAPVALDKVIALADAALPQDTQPAAEDSNKKATETEIVADTDKAIDEHVKNSDKQTDEQPAATNFAAELESMIEFEFCEEVQENFCDALEQEVYANAENYGNGYFKNRADDDLRPGILGTGRDFRARFEATFGNVTRDAKGNITSARAFGKDNRFFKSGKFFDTLNSSMQDAIAEGLITGVYYQSLDSGLKIGAGTISRGYKGVEAMVKPTLDKLQDKMEAAGSKFANWALPDGPSGAEIIDGMSDKEASEIIKTLDQAGWLNKLPEQARTVFLMNLSKSGVCYIDERGTLKKRNIIDRLIRDYENDPDRFFENLPGQLEEIKDIYKATALISKDSINTEAVYNRLKSATSVEQVRSILMDELNVIKKPLVSLQDLVISLSNDFISLMKTDKKYYRSLIDKIARSVEVMARDKGADSLSAISSAFLRNLAMSDNETEIRRTTEKLVVANVRYLNDMLGGGETTFSEQELDIEGANTNMENSPVMSTGGRTNIEPANLGKTAGWNETEMKDGSENKTTDPIGDAKDKVLATSSFSAGSTITLDPSTFYTPKVSSGADRVSAPGFGMDAAMQ